MKSMSTQALDWIGALALAGGTIGPADQRPTPAFAAELTTARPVGSKNSGGRSVNM